MNSKQTILILGLLAMVLFISSQVSARDLTETSKNEVAENANGLNDAKYGGYHNGGGYHKGGGGGYHNGGGGGGYHNGGGGGYHNGGGGGYHNGGGHGGGCRYKCCGGYYSGSCRRCCSYAGEPVDVQT